MYKYSNGLYAISSTNEEQDWLSKSEYMNYMCSFWTYQEIHVSNQLSSQLTLLLSSYSLIPRPLTAKRLQGSNIS